MKSTYLLTLFLLTLTAMAVELNEHISHNNYLDEQNLNLQEEDYRAKVEKLTLAKMKEKGISQNWQKYDDCYVRKGSVIVNNNSATNGMLYFEQMPGTSWDHQTKMYCYHMKPILCAKRINYDRPPYYVPLPSEDYAWSTAILANAPIALMGCEIMNTYHANYFCEVGLGAGWQAATTWEAIITPKFKDAMENNEEYGGIWGSQDYKYRKYRNYYAWANLTIPANFYWVMGDQDNNCWYDVENNLDNDTIPKENG